MKSLSNPTYCIYCECFTGACLEIRSCRLLYTVVNTELEFDIRGEKSAPAALDVASPSRSVINRVGVWGREWLRSAGRKAGGFIKMVILHERCPLFGSPKGSHFEAILEAMLETFWEPF